MKRRISGIGPALSAALILGLASTLADFIWDGWIPSHQMVYGLVHGALLLLLFGLVLGWHSGGGKAILRGAAGGLVIGLVAASGFYLLAPLVGIAAMFVSWMAFWLLFGFLHRWLQGNRERLALSALRGVLAALLSGAASYWTIRHLWLQGGAASDGYAFHLAAWTLAYLPGFLALLISKGEQKRSHAKTQSH